MATAVLVASGQLVGDRLASTALIGELALDGSLRPVPGILALVAAARSAGARVAVVPSENAAEAATVRGVSVLPATCFGAVVRHLAGVDSLDAAHPGRGPEVEEAPPDAPDLRSIVGQRVARRVLEVAVAGHHNLAFSGPPGVGKTLLSRAAAGLLPPLDMEEADEVRRIHSVAGVGGRPIGSRRRPFRAPHHTVSTQALVGGGPRIRPGEASLAHRGVLLLDETLQFRTDALDALRGPLDSGCVTIARVDGVRSLPARFMLIAAFNPCPCGWFGVGGRVCECEDGARRRYQARLSGPMRDRIDLAVPLAPVVSGTRRPVETTAEVAGRIADAWAVQRERQRCANAELDVVQLDRRHGFDGRLLRLLDRRGRQLGLSLRRLHRAARVARTIADLDGSSTVDVRHLDEALLHRPKEIAA